LSAHRRRLRQRSGAAFVVAAVSVDVDASVVVAGAVEVIATFVIYVDIDDKGGAHVQGAGYDHETSTST
jgi:hypothetical protein